MNTIKEKKEKILGVTIVIVGDGAHSRVARSNIYCRLNQIVGRSKSWGSATMLSLLVERLGAKEFYWFDAALIGVDGILMRRLQRERLGRALLPSIREWPMYLV